MTRQESEDRILPKAAGNRSQTRKARWSGGGKAVPVKEEGRQQRLNFVTAENPRKERGAESRRGVDRSTLRLQKAAKAKSKPKRVGPARMGSGLASGRRRRGDVSMRGISPSGH
jgi:hypothetical protein